MKAYIAPLLFILSLLFTNCKDEQPIVITCDNAVLATVKDLTGLDGCGFVFELADGTKLEPQMLFYCGTPPLPKDVTENPLDDFQWVDGKQVRIAYEEIPEVASICMAGKIVKITCLEEVSTTTE